MAAVHTDKGQSACVNRSNPVAFRGSKYRYRWTIPSRCATCQYVDQLYFVGELAPTKPCIFIDCSSTTHGSVVVLMYCNDGGTKINDQTKTPKHSRPKHEVENGHIRAVTLPNLRYRAAIGRISPRSPRSAQEEIQIKY